MEVPQGAPPVPEERRAPGERILDPVSRVSEILFGLIMALTFTGSLSAATAGHEEIRTMLIGAIGCNIAWGLVDAVMYLMTRLTERGRDLGAARAVRAATEPREAHRIIADSMPPIVASSLPDTAFEAVRRRLNELPGVPARPRLSKDDFLGALGVFLLVVVSTFPVAVPFLVMNQPIPALRVSNGIAIVLLFLCGYRLGRYSENRPWGMGLCMALVGSVLVAATIALGG